MPASSALAVDASNTQSAFWAEAAAVRAPRPQVALLLPCFNEERDLPVLLDRIGQALARAPFDYRIIVVDDGSSDLTAHVAQSAASALPVSLLQHRTNLGLGAALRTGLESLKDFQGTVVTMDADNSHDPALIAGMVRRIAEGYDVVIASRFQHGAKVVGVPLHRQMLSRIASLASRLLFSYRNVRDYSSGYRAYSSGALARLREQYGNGYVRESGFACMLELLLKLRKVRARACEVPMVLRYDRKLGVSKMRILRTVFRYAVVYCLLFPSRSRRSLAPRVT